MLPHRSLPLLLYLLILHAPVTAEELCPFTQFFSPKFCAAGSMLDWRCVDCTKDAVQYIIDGQPKDEGCMCNAGFSAIDASYYCGNYGIANNYEYPLVQDKFTCISCTTEEMCPGGIIYNRVDQPMSDVYYVADSTNPRIGYRIVSALEIFRSDYQGYTSFIYRTHVPKLRCKIFGQSVRDGTTNPYCFCPDYSVVQYQTRAESAGIMSITLDAANGVQALKPGVKNVWNLDVLPDFGMDPTNKQFFGFCKCLVGYFRSGADLRVPCEICPPTSYCVDGARIACSSGWDTGKLGATTSAECSKCTASAPCKAGTYCNELSPQNWNVADKQCEGCPVGYKCPADNMRQPMPCDPGTYQDETRQASCKPCAAGKFSASSGATECTSCAAGKYSAASAPLCTECPEGKYSPSPGMPECIACSGANVYQPSKGGTECFTCGPGYMNKAILPVNVGTGYKGMTDVCEACILGKYSAQNASTACDPCPSNTYNDLAGQAKCKPCPSDKYTGTVTGATSASQCVCAANRYDTGTGKCNPCGSCMQNEYAVTECSTTGDVQCAVCDACPSVGSYVLPGSMCKGTGNVNAQSCASCTPEASCSKSSTTKFRTLFKCYTGRISYDTSVCVSENDYKNPLTFNCDQGWYQNPFASHDEASEFTFDGEVYLNSGNTHIAVLNPSGVLKIYQSESRQTPFKVALDPRTLLKAEPVLQAQPSVVDTYPSSFRVIIDGTRASTAEAEQSPETPPTVHPNLRLFSSGVWSFDGSAFFVVWMDGTISKAVVSPPASISFTMYWSPRPSAALFPALQPIWYVRYPATAPYDRFIKHACVSVPVHDPDATLIDLAKQIQLVCAFDYLRDGPSASSKFSASSSFGTYFLRVYAGSGVRLPIDMQRHTLPFASSSLLYDVSFNAIHVSSYKSTSYAGRKQVFSILLSPSYNFQSETSSTASSSTSSFPKAAQSTFYQMPAPVPAGALYPSYPVNISFDFASVEPLSNHLFFYVPTVVSAGVYLNKLYFIPPSDSVNAVNANGKRSPQQPLLVETDATRLSLVTRNALASISSVSEANGLRLVFTLRAGLFVGLGSTPSLTTSSTYYQLATCTRCPERMTSIEGATSAGDCFCEPGTFFSAATQRCEDAKLKCGDGEYIAAKYTRDSDTQCLPCPVCPLGFYRDPSDCNSDKLRDPLKPVLCRQCTGCSPGFYINPVRCNPRGTTNINPAYDCLTCNVCGPMQTIVGRPCPGDTLYNTQSCQTCTASCPAGTVILPTISRCNGASWFNPDGAFDPLLDCKPCDPCRGANQAKVGGCTGKFFDYGPTCIECATCAKGEYIQGTCSSPTSSSSNTTTTKCAKCPACEAGKYESIPCTGDKLNEPSNECLRCATCPQDTYMLPCGLQNRSAAEEGVTDAFGRLLPPPDAGRCAACGNCSAGFYTSQRCNGTTIADTHRCSKCSSKCPYGTYMHAQCAGDTFEADSNDCRPCAPCALGEYMSAGKCVDGTGATNPWQRTCEPCSNCAQGEYKVTVCSGTEAYDALECRSCGSCPAGTYISAPCEGSGTSPNLQCTECRSCPKGFYRVGCTGSSTFDDVKCLQCDPCPDGSYISPDEAQQCPGTGFSPTDRRCVQCPSCGAGRYYATGCTGVETTSTYTCGDCAGSCPGGMYIAKGCNGRTSSPAPQMCLPCAPCGDREYIMTPCTGTGITSTSRTCARCSCKPGFTPISPCSSNGMSNYVCKNMITGVIDPPPQLLVTAEQEGDEGKATTTSATPTDNRGETTATQQQQLTSTGVVVVQTTPKPTPVVPPSFIEQYMGLVVGASVGVGLLLLGVIASALVFFK